MSPGMPLYSWQLAELVLCRCGRTKPPLDFGGAVGNRRKPDNGNDVVAVHRPPVDLLQEVDGLVEAAELGVVVLDVSGGELGHSLDLDAVDHGLEYALAGLVLEADRD